VDSIYYTASLMNKLNNLPPVSTFPCSVLVNEGVLGGLFMVCPPADLKYFNIKPRTVPQPALKFRMINYQKESFIIEIWLAFENEIEKSLKLHLNPHDINVKEFMGLCAKTKAISFHFYNTKTKEATAAITFLKNEELQWFERNYVAIEKLTANNQGFAMLTDILRKQINKTDLLYNYLPTPDSAFFINEGCSLSKLEGI